jgi:hypothetical protein
VAPPRACFFRNFDYLKIVELKLIIFDFSGTLAYLKNFDFEGFFSDLADFEIKLKTEEEKNYFISFCSEIWGWAKNWLDLSQKLLKNYIIENSPIQKISSLTELKSLLV